MSMREANPQTSVGDDLAEGGGGWHSVGRSGISGIGTGGDGGRKRNVKVSLDKLEVGSKITEERVDAGGSEVA